MDLQPTPRSSEETPHTAHELAQDDAPRTETARPAAGRRRPLARRVVLRASAVLPAGIGLGALAACSDEGASGTGSAPDATSDVAQGSDSPQEGERGTAAETASGDDEAGPGFPAQEVPVGGAAYDESTNTVLTQPSDGDFRTFDATCPHQGCSVSEFSDGALQCPCHGSRFDPGSGDVLRGPAPEGLSPREVTREGGSLVVG